MSSTNGTPQVIVFGSLNMDLSIACARMPEAGETLAGRDLVINPGGKGANQAVAAARLGARTLMIGAVGSDDFGDRLTRSLAASGVAAGVIERVDATTGAAIIMRTGSENRIILDPGANHALSASDVARALDDCARAGDIFVTQLECAHDATFAALQDAHARGLYTIFNPAPASPVPSELWEKIDLICLNETECEIVCGIRPETANEIERAMEALGSRGARRAVLTLGASGSAVMEEGALARIEAVPVEAVDSTAAGDTYIGALAARIARGESVLAAARYASMASALTVTRVGAQQSIPTFEEIETFERGLG